MSISAAVYAAVSGMPTELCRLMQSYVDESPHRWSPFEPFVGVSKTDNGTTFINGHIRDDGPWRTMVSSTSFATGHLHWSVEFLSESVQIDRWIGYGVTAKTVNFEQDVYWSTYRDIAQKHAWILFIDRSSRSFHIGHADKVSSAGVILRPAADGGLGRIRIDFAADPFTGAVVADIQQYVESDVDAGFVHRGRVTLVVVGTAEFRLLRPAVVVAGDVTAMVRSESALS